MLSDDLIELGQEAVDAVSSGIASGAPLVKCQLLASAFYEALRHELRRADETKRGTLLAVTDQCHRGAVAHISPDRMLNELRRAIALLQMPSQVPPTRARPILRVIEGGLSKA